MKRYTPLNGVQQLWYTLSTTINPYAAPLNLADRVGILLYTKGCKAYPRNMTATQRIFLP